MVQELIDKAKTKFPISIYYTGQLSEEDISALKEVCDVRCPSVYEILECARTGEDKRFRKLYRKLSNKDIPPARTGCGMSFKEKNKSRRKSCNGKLLSLDNRPYI